jgi:hypothetical protein
MMTTRDINEFIEKALLLNRASECLLCAYRRFEIGEDLVVSVEVRRKEKKEDAKKETCSCAGNDCGCGGNCKRGHT